MKTLTLRIAILASLATAMPIALAKDANFPDFPKVGRSYNIDWAQDAKLVPGRIKIIRKTEGPWIFVEYTHLKYTRFGMKNPTPVTKQFWVNTHWIVTASELEPEKE